MIKNLTIIISLFILMVGCSQESPDSKSADLTVYNAGSRPSNELDGTAIICESYFKLNFPKVGIDGFRFEDSKVKRDRIVTKNNIVSVLELGATNLSYYTSTESISWWGAFELNRKTLILYTRDGEIYNKTHSCKVYSNLNEYTEDLTILVIEQEKEIEKRMSGNKI